MVELIEHKGVTYAILVIAEARPEELHHFMTDPQSPLQVGRLIFGKGHTVDRHYHPPIERTVKGTPEVLILESGMICLEIFDVPEGPEATPRIIASRILDTKDMIILLHGGHQLYVIEKASILEVKQGPYLGRDDKVRY